MEKVLRGHHLLCVHGFRGMGYSPSFVKNMWKIVEDIRDDKKDFLIRVEARLDDACMACPHKGLTTCEADEGSNEHVIKMDERVLSHLQLEKGKSYKKSELVKLTAEKVHPKDLDTLCHGCSWLLYGVCKEGIANLRNKFGICD